MYHLILQRQSRVGETLIGPNVTRNAPFVHSKMGMNLVQESPSRNALPVHPRSVRPFRAEVITQWSPTCRPPPTGGAGVLFTTSGPHHARPVSRSEPPLRTWPGRRHRSKPRCEYNFKFQICPPVPAVLCARFGKSTR